MRLATLSLLLGGCIGSQGGAVMLPARYDVGAATSHHGESATHVTAGLHWASLWPKSSTPVDVGLGWLFEKPAAREAMEAPRPMLHGPYAEVSYRVHGTRHHRTWLGLRTEFLKVPLGPAYQDGLGLTARAAWEVFAAGKGSFYCGAVGLGLFAEASYRRLPQDRNAGVVITGVSLRLPAAGIGK